MNDTTSTRNIESNRETINDDYGVDHIIYVYLFYYYYFILKNNLYLIKS